MSEQCKGMTKSGRRCRNRGDFANGFCRLHAGQARRAYEQAAPDDTATDTGTARETSRWCCGDAENCLKILAVAAVAILTFLTLRLLVGPRDE
ncbi:MAG: hypothetical protein GF418_03055 [Chitinivibrionales bacterium]|nr:hypothetical protein [Chitinivibrionales bacterium]MBD3394581.1 hypothetical protein [Chitinivibrionales bacterium]